MSSRYDQWIRKVGLLVVKPGAAETDADNVALDLSEFHIRFTVSAADIESPNTAVITVYNLSPKTVKQIYGEYSEVILNAGYENGNYGIIFRGTIKQFKVGRENATDTYLTIYAADGDIGYNQGVIAASFAKGATPIDAMKAIAASMPGISEDFGQIKSNKQFVPQIRGSVQMGMARARLRNLVTYLDCGWSIQDGKVVVTDNTGYRDGEAIDINVANGLIGQPEQTDDGINVQCLLNSKIRIGGRVKLNNDEIAALIRSKSNVTSLAYNQWAGFQYLAPLSEDGMYRAFSVNHIGDNRGQAWYTNLICLAVNETVAQDKSVNFQ